MQTDGINVTFRLSEAAFANSLGLFKVDADGSLTDIELLFTDLSDDGSPYGAQANIDDLGPEEAYGFFLLPNGFNQHRTIAEGGTGLNGRLQLVDRDTGEIAHIDGNSPLRLAVEEADGSLTILDGPVYVAGAPGLDLDDLNPGGLNQAEIETLADGRYRLSFEDLHRASGAADDDFDDAVLIVRPLELGSVSHKLESDAYSISYSEDIHSIIAARIDGQSSDSTDWVVFSTDSGIYVQPYNQTDQNFQSSDIFRVSASDGDGRGYTYLWAIDLNNDGNDDLVAFPDSSDASQPVIDVLMGAGSTSEPYDAPTSFNVNVNVDTAWTDPVFTLGDATFGDVNQDGNIDIILAGMAQYTVTQPGEDPEDPPVEVTTSEGYYAIGLGDGTGGFSFPGPIAATYVSETGEDAIGFLEDLLPRVSAADFNRDGYLDAAFAYHNTVTAINFDDVQVVFGDSSLKDSPPTFDFNNNLVNTNHTEPQDVLAVDSQYGSLFLTDHGSRTVGGLGDEADFYLAAAFDSSSHFIYFSSDTSISSDEENKDTPRGPMGDATDLNGDGNADVQYLDGNSSLILDGYDWTNPSQSDPLTPGYVFGTDIQTGAFGDFNGDGYIDWVGANKSDIHYYINATFDDA